ncbi:MAG: hypothetical protein IPG75_20930 [Gemmatimonadetes bacterium]|nr:hypothetical protein [Gemmatimonadota bacterium]
MNVESLPLPEPGSTLAPKPSVTESTVEATATEVLSCQPDGNDTASPTDPVPVVLSLPPEPPTASRTVPSA